MPATLRRQSGRLLLRRHRSKPSKAWTPSKAWKRSARFQENKAKRKTSVERGGLLTWPVYNRVILVGNLTRDPELRYTPSNTAVTEIGLAVNDRRKNANGEWIEETTFVDVTLWARQAEVASEYLTKGSSVLIEGRLKLDTWESNDGQKRSKLRVVGERMQMLGGRGGGGWRRSRWWWG